MTYEDTNGMAHVVILENADELKVVEFDGANANDKAHALAVEQSLTGKYIATVCVRVRTCGGFALAKNLNHSLVKL